MTYYAKRYIVQAAPVWNQSYMVFNYSKDKVNSYNITTNNHPKIVLDNFSIRGITYTIDFPFPLY